MKGEEIMEARTNARLGLGSALATIGGIAFVLGPALGLTDLGRPWTFLAGLAVGMTAGAGGALVIGGLLEKRKNR
jgi:hypothetical protein